MKPLVSILFVFLLLCPFAPARAQLNDDTAPVRAQDGSWRAPFAGRSADESEIKGGLNDLYRPSGSGGDTDDLSLPHRYKEDVAQWVETFASKALTMAPQTFADRAVELSPYMSGAAKEEYRMFLDSLNAPEAITRGGMILDSYVEEPPFLLNEGRIGGQYRWLFETPVTMTFRPAGGKQEPINRRMTLLLEVGRVPAEQTPDGDGIRLESWVVRPVKKLAVPEKR
ncbi:MAG: DotI/IcmL family type IV secretion protein [Alphaproteobacteria bacterium]|nr:DotI/IcmL family type IV secretion protein [Alphaproteobacteria bacterium]